MVQNGTWYKTVHGTKQYMVQNGTLQNGTLQNGTLQNGTVTEWERLQNVTALHISTVQKLWDK
jgi:hypothetical protein